MPTCSASSRLGIASHMLSTQQCYTDTHMSGLSGCASTPGHAYLHTNQHSHIHTQTPVPTRLYLHAGTHMLTPARPHPWTPVPTADTCMPTPAHPHLHVHTCTSTPVHRHLHIHTCTRVPARPHLHANTYMSTPARQHLHVHTCTHGPVHPHIDTCTEESPGLLLAYRWNTSANTPHCQRRAGPRSQYYLTCKMHAAPLKSCRALADTLLVPARVFPFPQEQDLREPSDSTEKLTPYQSSRVKVQLVLSSPTTDAGSAR
ncbi:hypothetical protein DFH08DRAFT_967273 [Mycena albidolilacea]|uniref:Uncharacterized protein n=1 Tax=Mycena albidolilacea TaxID=1033008 RepID=A0AAD6ZMB4_9AGAR|nr:hypothetical protein DFH08DRAFT_967273 [Mycena albidolilacea]